MKRLMLLAASLAFGGCGSGGVHSSSSNLCNDYLTCLAMVSPGEIGAAEVAYGPMSSCWQSSQSASTCEDECKQMKSSLDCPCTSDSECAMQIFGQLRRCDTTTHECVQCLKDADCTSIYHYCSGDHRCVQCRASDNAGCSTNTPYCLPGAQSTYFCGECGYDSDHPCKNGAACGQNHTCD